MKNQTSQEYLSCGRFFSLDLDLDLDITFYRATPAQEAGAYRAVNRSSCAGGRAVSRAVRFTARAGNLTA